MMDQATQLELQAYLDGELSPAEAVGWQRRIDSEPQLRALALELQASNQALAVFEAETRVPANRDFYWSGIRRQIEAQETAVPKVGATAAPLGWFGRLWQYLVPAGVTAAFLIAGLLATHQVRMADGSPMRLEASASSPGTFTYRDFSSGVTLVWLSYPAEKEFAEIDTILRIP